ncbi:hypothetical protein SSS_10726, partial [Sarcoptes scabiei]
NFSVCNRTFVSTSILHSFFDQYSSESFSPKQSCSRSYFFCSLSLEKRRTLRSAHLLKISPVFCYFLFLFVFIFGVFEIVQQKFSDSKTLKSIRFAFHFFTNIL